MTCRLTFGADPSAVKQSPIAAAIEAIKVFDGTYSYRPPSEEVREIIRDLGYDPRCFWEIRRVTLGPHSSGRNAKLISDKELASLRDHLLVLGSVYILDLDDTEVSRSRAIKLAANA